MKKAVSLIMVAALLTLGIVSFSGVASAEEVKMVGVIQKIDLAAGGKTATVTLKDNKSGKSVAITVTDDLTLDKFKDHRIVEGDEIRCKYETDGGKNHSKLFRKTAGC
ncbi:hypothetical protein [Geobacter pickeringii]|uniref:DUF5666 domain-containing protein n=1 Tax=Geobacter pickeringii TaxID=345632 RepID=A0A0B5BGM8_9BACT|nr:hypothetical protein [Geobacter pickeringii]AJE03670.1 hypothetical protein GPICK_10200 [Geobacter pickeringii]